MSTTQSNLPAVDLNILKRVEFLVPRMDTRIVEGLAYHQLRTAEEYVDAAWRCAETGLPPGMTYVGCVRCTPQETFTEMTRPANSNRTFDLADSDVFLVKYLFKFNGKDLAPQYMLLPYAHLGNVLHLAGALYQLYSVIGGRVFNIEHSNIYMHTPRIRMGFWQFNYSCYMNNKIVNQTGVGSYLFHIQQKTDRSPLYPTLLHYILAEFGLSKTLKDYFKVDAKILYEQDAKKLSTNEWCVYRSKNHYGVTKHRNNITGASLDNIRSVYIAIPKSQHYPLLNNVISTLYYILDCFPEATQEIESLEDPLLWLRLLDNFIFKAQAGETKIYDRMRDHLHGLKNTLDPMTQRNLKQSDIDCNTIFDLFTYIIIHYQDIVIHYDVGTMYDKELSINKHLLYNVVYKIFKTMYELQKISPNLLTVDKINKTLRANLKRDIVLKLVGHGELSARGVATQCLLHGSTGNIISHSKATIRRGKASKGRTVSANPAMALHHSQAEVGSLTWITGSGPTGREKHNPFSNLVNGTVVRNPELIDLIENFRQLLAHRP